MSPSWASVFTVAIALVLYFASLGLAFWLIPHYLHQNIVAGAMYWPIIFCGGGFIIIKLSKFFNIVEFIEYIKKIRSK